MGKQVELKPGKLLIISWNIYPWPTGSAIIVDNIVKQFSSEEVVIIVEKYPQEFQTSWVNEYPKIYYLDPNINIFGRGQTHLRWLKASSVMNQLKKIIEKEKITKVLAVFPDDFYLIASFLVCKKLKIPFYTWFHNTYSDNLKSYRGFIARFLEPKILSFAKMNFVISDGLLAYFNLKYPKFQFKTILHGFNIPEVDKLKEFNIISNNHLKFLFTGSLNDSCLDATIRLCKRIILNPNHELHLYTGNSFKDFAEHGIAGKNVFYKGFISLEKLQGVMLDYDIVLLPHGFTGGRTKIEFDTIFPTRTIPLLISRRPILAHTPKNVFFTNWLSQKNCAFIVDSKNEREIDDIIQYIKENPKVVVEKVNNAIEASYDFDVTKTSNKLRNYTCL